MFSFCSLVIFLWSVLFSSLCHYFYKSFATWQDTDKFHDACHMASSYKSSHWSYIQSIWKALATWQEESDKCSFFSINCIYPFDFTSKNRKNAVFERFPVKHWYFFTIFWIFSKNWRFFEYFFAIVKILYFVILNT